MTKIHFIADVFAEQHLGGGELSNQELIKLLRQKEKEVIALISKGFPLQKVGIVMPHSEDLVLTYQNENTPLLPKGWDAFGS